ncbi:MAG: zf-TFIIB domain-containing protein, partial [Gammaproteobacteria bacterium]
EHGVSMPTPTARVDHVLDCPRCDNPLRASTAGNATIDDCEHCGGVWLDLDVFELALRKEEGKSEVVAAVQALVPAKFATNEIKPQTGARFYVPCPHCAKIMDRRQFAKVSRVVIDVCKDHGIWLDHDELPRIVRFVADGGLYAARKVQLEQQVENLLSRREGTAQSLSFPSRRYEFGSNYGNVFLDAIAGVIAALFR